MDDCDKPLMPLEEQSVYEVDSGEIDAMITSFETLSNMTEEVVSNRGKKRQSGLWSLGRSLDRT